MKSIKTKVHAQNLLQVGIWDPNTLEIADPDTTCWAMSSKGESKDRFMTLGKTGKKNSK